MAEQCREAGEKIDSIGNSEEDQVLALQAGVGYLEMQIAVATETFWSGHQRHPFGNFD